MDEQLEYITQESLDEVVRLRRERRQHRTVNSKEEIIDDNTIVENAEESNEIEEAEPIHYSSEAHIKSLYEKSPTILLNEFKKYNNIDSNVLEGEYKKISTERNFGSFVNIESKYGQTLKYPVINTDVDSVYIGTTNLTVGQRYLFEVQIAKIKERKKWNNPYLLETINNEKKIIEISELSNEILNKQKELASIKDASAQAVLEHNNFINEVTEERKTFYAELDRLNESVVETKEKLHNMENLITTLKDRISICKNLDFITDAEEDRYLRLLSGQETQLPNHLDFEEDFGNNFAALANHIHTYLYHKKNLIYTRHQIRNFLALLRTNDLIVLSGLSGSGKTQIVKAFAEALGGVAKIIPVKPNWTSSDDLIGYYNPLQNSFLPTPFTEAIVEAIHNPSQLYLICLDEMNLARAEYYFADFLSKLEERSKQPEIELYAKHEEELFISEFNTLLNLIESSINGLSITSWQDFLNNDEARTAFFEMLGNADKESMLQLHSKMKRRLIDILKFPSTIQIPNNVRFIGAINIDETTHYFSPKILDRVHIMKFENPLLIEDNVRSYFADVVINDEIEMLPVHLLPSQLSERKEYPSITDNMELADMLKEINKQFLLPLNIDFGVRSIRQALNYAELSDNIYSDMLEKPFDVSLNTIMLQKVLPRFIFDGSEKARNGIKTKLDLLKDFKDYLGAKYSLYTADGADDVFTQIGSETCYGYLSAMIDVAEKRDSQINFFA